MAPKRSGTAAGIQALLPEGLASPAAHCDSVAASETPSTMPRLAGERSIRARQVGAALNIDAEPVKEKGKEFLYNIDLHGLQPTLSVRTRILLATWSLQQMPPSDIAKSFEVAGYVPRRRPLKLQAALDALAIKSGELRPGEVRTSRRSVIDKVPLSWDVFWKLLLLMRSSGVRRCFSVSA
jgi:hypothetical protein